MAGGFFKRLVSGLTKTRDNIVAGMDSIFHGFSKIDDDFYEELEHTEREKDHLGYGCNTLVQRIHLLLLWIEMYCSVFCRRNYRDGKESDAEY